MSSLKNITAESFDSLALVAVGSNMPSVHGDPEATVAAAVQRLKELTIGEMQVSSFLRSEPVDCPPGSAPFINAVVILEPLQDFSAEDFLREMHIIEQQFGRIRKGIINAPRPLDLDLLAYGRLIQATPFLTLPHPRAHLRQFVLQPLQEIAPDYVFPGQQRTVSDLLKSMESQTRGDTDTSPEKA